MHVCTNIFMRIKSSDFSNVKSDVIWIGRYVHYQVKSEIKDI